MDEQDPQTACNMAMLGNVSVNGLLEPCIPLPIDPCLLDRISSSAKDFALSHGIGMRPRDSPGHSMQLIRFALLPSPFPKQLFHFAKSIQCDINLMLHNVSHDYDFLKSGLTTAIEVDSFTEHVFKVYETVLKEGHYQPYSLGILRSDYMLNQYFIEGVEMANLKQVEVNAISSSLGALSTRIRDLHWHVLAELKAEKAKEKLPVNITASELARGLIAAKDVYGQPDAGILFVIQEKDTNVFDQRILEFEVKKIRQGLLVLRHTFAEIRAKGSLRNNAFFLDGQEIAVVYYRTAYVPEQYEPQDWDTRLMLERSLAIKCPSAALHLAGTKKVQQLLSLPGTLERFVSDAQAAQKIALTFAGQYSLDMDAEGDRNAMMAMEFPERFVLKPQLEGGGNNIYAEDVRPALEKLNGNKKRGEYILMDLISKRPVLNYAVESNQQSAPPLCNIIGELGIYGVFLGTRDHIVENYEAGHVLRSKLEESNEGGLMTGCGMLDSPLLW